MPDRENELKEYFILYSDLRSAAYRLLSKYDEDKNDKHSYYKYLVLNEVMMEVSNEIKGLWRLK